MGLMELPPVEPGRLIVTPHPALLDGQRNVVWEARPGESLYAILQRNVPEMDGQRWEVCIGGVPVERHLWHHVFPKPGQVIEVRGGVGRSALALVAMIALTYFTFGGGAIAGWTLGTSTAFGTLAVQSAVYMAGSMLINKVLAPKPPKVSNQQQDSVYSISGARNQLRPYEPIPLLFGRVRIAPDLLSKPYTWYEGNDQFLGLQLCAGINVGRIEEIYNGDTLLSSYDGVQVYHAGYSGMPDQDIPLYSNADTIDGAELEKSGAWVERTTSADTMRIQINLEYILGGQGTSGKNYDVSETIVSEYRVVGATNWMPLVTRTFRSSKFDVRRATLSRDVERGQYDVRVRMLGKGNYEGKNTQKNDFQWTQLTSVQADEADYTWLSRTGIRIKATGQLNGSPDELRAVGFADPIPEWNGTTWVTKESSNPGAQCVAYARGIVREGRLLGGMQLSEDQIDLASWKAFTLHCAANGYSYNHYIKDSRNHEQVLSAIALAGFGQITWAGGRLGVVWAAQDQPLSGVVNMATIKKGQFQVDYNLSNAADGIEYTYIDSATWEAKTLRVPVPGVTTMLNPAQVAGEGVSTEHHAARMARWHLAQSLYQYKDISYSTDIEHLSYQRMSLLAMQHDMTQWGYGGRVAAAVNASGMVTLTLDEPVPAPATGNAYIGLRIPGERVYRVLRVKPFTGESRTVELAEAWPTDAVLPGNSDSNPAHDTLWIYDFKQTPGLRVRVTSIEPESDLKGASVRVVAEGPEFWNYVLTGDYIPPPNQSLLQTRPVASNLRVTEQQVVQGNTTFTELTATFDVTGPVGTTIVRAGIAGGELQDVAQTVTRTATWRINEPGQYTVVVRPYSPDGEAGVAVQATYTTSGAGAPPVLVDLFDVQERSGGVRLYTWGWLADTMQSPDFAGVEIRYTAGNVATPDWETMTPLGESGYYTAPFESVLPPAGDWTIACRSRNTAGLLSVEMRTVSYTFGPNLGEVIDGIDGTVGQTLDDLIALQQAVDQETYDRIAGDLATASAAGADATAKANAARDAALAAVAQVNDQVIQLTSQVDVISGQIGDITNADLWSVGESYPEGDHVKYDGKLYRALQPSVGMQPNTNPTYWQWVGDYSSVGEAVAASLSMSRTNASDIDVQTSRVDGIVVRMPTGTDKLANEARVVAAETAAANATSAVANRVGAVEVRMPAGNGELATSARVASEESARVSGDNALGSRIGLVEGRMPTGTDKLANEARVATAENASVSRDNALGSRIGVVEVRMPTGTDKLANEARVATAENASVSRDNALGSRIDLVTAQIPGAGGNLIKKSDFADMSAAGWGNATVSTAPSSGLGSQPADTYRGPYLTTVPGGTYEANFFPVTPGEVLDVAVNIFNTVDATGRFGIHFVDANEASIDWKAPDGPAAGAWVRQQNSIATPANAARARAWLMGGSGGNNVRITQPDIRRAGAGVGALSTALSELRSSVNQQGEDIEAISSSIQVVNSELAGKADTSALNALSSKVTQQGNTITSQGNAITSVSAKVGDQPGNIVKKSDFSDGSAGNWINALVEEPPSSGWGSQPTSTYQGKYITPAPGGTYEQSLTPCTPGEVYEVSANIFNTSNVTGYFGIHFVDKNGSNIDWVNPYGGTAPGVWTFKTGNVTVPAGASRMRPFLNQGSSPNIIRITQPKIVKQSAQAVATASAVQLLDVRVSTTESGLTQAKAQWAIKLDVNGKISGLTSINNGTTSSFEILADVFRVISSGMTGFEIQAGYQRNYSSGAQLVMGHNFGVNNDLILWYGPNIGAAACSKGNATIWFDKGGNAYFGGSLSAGVLRNGAQSTQIGSNAVVETGQFGTNGNAKVVTYSLNYSNSFVTATNLGGNAALSATVILERSIGGGAWVEVSRRVVNGNRTYEGYEPGIGYSYSFIIAGSSTFTDNTGGSSSTFNYRVRLEGVTGWPYARPEGGASAWGKQSLSVLSIEQ